MGTRVEKGVNHTVLAREEGGLVKFLGLAGNLPRCSEELPACQRLQGSAGCPPTKGASNLAKAVAKGKRDAEVPTSFNPSCGHLAH